MSQRAPRLTAILLIAVAACGRLAPTELCARAHEGVDIVESKGKTCLAETSFHLAAFDTGACAARVESDCSEGDRARMEQWLECWDALPACSDRNRASFVSAGNACAKTTGLAEVPRRCRVVFGDTSTR
ncbi:MAG: hypothetical protein IT381_11060 [Deltaproteobacteria bacterium]|nr:hypothetical protein [Deltaproteobacteria bacterium]